MRERFGTAGAPFSPALADACVVSAVRSIDGMSNVTYKLESESWPLTSHGIEKPDEVHRFWYEYKGAHNNFYLLVSYKASYHHVGGIHEDEPPHSHAASKKHASERRFLWEARLQR